MTVDPLVLSVDASTTAAKATCWTPDGRAVSEGRAPIPLLNPEPGGYEQDAAVWWSATVEAIRQALGPVDAARLAAMCVTHQRETVVLTDAALEPIRPALVWMDDRCRPQVAEAEARLGAERLHQLSGKPPCTTPSLYKLLGLKARDPEAFAAAPRVLDVHGFLVGRLVGEARTSPACADPMGLIDMRTQRWSPELMALLGVSEAQLAPLSPVGAVIGEVSAEAAEACGLPAGLPVVAGAGDGQCAGLGAGIDAPGRAYLNLGTAIVSGVVSERYLLDRAFRTLLAAVPGRYMLETDLKGGTFTLTWMVERLLGRPGEVSATLKELEPAATALPPGADGLMLVPYWNGVMNPHWDDDATGAVVGWHGGHTAAHLFRAVLEGIAFEQRLHTEGVEAAAGPIEEFVVMGGGSRSDLWCQILADVTGKPIVRAGTVEATSLGAAMLAAAGAGVHADLSAAVAAMSGASGARFLPGPGAPRYDRLYREVYVDLYPGLAGPLRRLMALTRG